MYGTHHCKITYIVRDLYSDFMTTRSSPGAYTFGLWPDAKYEMLERFHKAMTESGELEVMVLDVEHLDCTPAGLEEV